MNSPIRQNHDSDRCTGFTLLELVAAMTLMALMLAGLASVFRVLVRDSAAKVGRDAAMSTTAIELLRRDVANARAFRTAANTLELVGYNLLSTEDSGALMLPAWVRYHVATKRSGTALVRTQSDQLGAMTQRIIWVGVSEFRVSTGLLVGNQDDAAFTLPTSLAGLAGRRAESARWQSVEGLVKVELIAPSGVSVGKGLLLSGASN